MVNQSMCTFFYIHVIDAFHMFHLSCSTVRFTEKKICEFNIYVILYIREMYKIHHMGFDKYGISFSNLFLFSSSEVKLNGNL